MPHMFEFVTQHLDHLSPHAQAAWILVMGMALAILVRLGLRRLLRWFRFEPFAERIGLKDFLRKGGARYSPLELVAVMAFWLILFTTFRHMARVLDLEVFRAFYRQMDKALPHLIGAVLTVVLGWLIVTFLARFALTLARNAAMPSAQAISAGIRAVGMVIVGALALDQVGFGSTILAPLILMTFAGLVLALALAFGLGCKDLAREATERFLRELRERHHMSNGADLEG